MDKTPWRQLRDRIAEAMYIGRLKDDPNVPRLELVSWAAKRADQWMKLMWPRIIESDDPVQPAAK